MGRVIKVVKKLIGHRKDWWLEMPYIRTPQIPGINILGPLIVIGSSVWLSWAVIAGGGPSGDANSSGLFEGTLSILFMAWSFILAVRIKSIESFFGGLDSIYRLHRWIGALAIPLMLLHSEVADISNGFLWASDGAADSAEDLAGTAILILGILVAVSLLRWIPYNYWKISHKLIGIPYVMASWHVYTAEKPIANDSVTGIALTVLMALGVVAYLYRVIVMDLFLKGSRYKISHVARHGSVTELVLSPLNKALKYKPGQFVAIKIEKRGFSEPHVFTIAEPHKTDNLKFFIKDLGDWSHALQTADLVGMKAYVEGPYGRFHAYKRGRQNIWVAGGVGITPFLSIAASLKKKSTNPPMLYFSVRSRKDAVGLEILQQAKKEGRIRMKLIVTSEGERFSQAMLEGDFAAKGLQGAHLAMCGPTRLLETAEKSARKLGARSIDSEDFDFRRGFGPSLNWDISKIIPK